MPRTTARRVSAARANGGGRRRDQEVLDAAIKVFHERGYSAATVQDVADELGILKGSLYHYIKTKEDLLFRLLETVHWDVEGLLEEIREVEGLSPLQRLRLYVTRQVEYNLDNLALISVYYHDMERLSVERSAQLVDLRRRNTAFVTNLIKEAQEAGEADPNREARLMANCLFATVIWTYRWYRPGSRDSRAAIAEECAAFAIGGLIGEQAPPEPPPKPRRKSKAR